MLWRILKRIVLGIVLFLGVIISIAFLFGESPQDKVTSADAAFDVPSLVGKDVAGLVAILGVPDYNVEPTPLQLESGTKTWEKSWKKDGYGLMATYEIETKKVIHLFLSGDTDARFVEFKDTDNILKAGNLSKNTAEYSVEFVKVMNGPGYTGAIVTPR